MKRLDATAQPWERPTLAELPPGSEMLTTIPARPASIAADLLVPIGQAAVTGALLAGLVAFGVARIWELRGRDLLTLWAGVTLAISAVAWVILLGQHRRLLWAVERLTGRDLDRDGATGDPSKRRLEVEVKQGPYTRFVGAEWLGIEDDRLLAFAAGIDRGRGLTEAAWGKDGAVFPKGINQWRAFRAKLAEAGLIVPTSGAANATYAWTAAGRAFIARLLAYAKEGD